MSADWTAVPAGAGVDAPLTGDGARRRQDLGSTLRSPQGALSPYEMGLRNALVLAFGTERFSLQDLWREHPGRHAWPALYEGSGTGRWPEPAWAELMRRALTRLPGVETAPV